MATGDNLQAAFAGESQANRKYLAFARKADAEGFPQVARLFRAAADAETIHAHNHLRAMKGVKSTAENLVAAIEGEGYEFKEMYPKFLAEAQAEQNKQGTTTFEYALAAEEVHHRLYKEAENAVNAGKDLEGAAIFVCQVCGHTVLGAPPAECPVCKAKQDRFKEVA